VERQHLNPDNQSLRVRQPWALIGIGRIPHPDGKAYVNYSAEKLDSFPFERMTYDQWAFVVSY